MTRDVDIYRLRKFVIFAIAFSIVLLSIGVFQSRSSIDRFANWAIIRFGFQSVVICAIGFWLYSYSTRPLNLIKGLAIDKYRAKKFQINLSRKSKLIGQKLPPVFPNGWFCLVESRFLESGRIVGVNALGNEFIVFRSSATDQKNRIHVMDAYCPHMGAHLASGGRVVDDGDRVQCPFHGWTFDGRDGRCVAIPYSETNTKIPDAARIKTWPCVELNGHVYVWYHSDRSEPYWDVPEIDEITRGEWTYRGRTEHYVASHIQDIPENGADVAHLSFLHRASILRGSDIIDSIDLSSKRADTLGEHRWTAEWRQSSEHKHVGILRLEHNLELFGVQLPLTRFRVEARQIGPGMVHLHYDAGPLGRGVYTQHVTPVEPLLQKVVHHIYAERKTPTLVAKFFLWAEAQQVERDIIIWNEKRYVMNPILIKEDSLIQRHRRWFNQFYTESSPKLEDTMGGLDF